MEVPPVQGNGSFVPILPLPIVLINRYPTPDGSCRLCHPTHGAADERVEEGVGRTDRRDAADAEGDGAVARPDPTNDRGGPQDPGRSERRSRRRRGQTLAPE